MAETTSAPSLRELSEAAPYPIKLQAMGIIVHTETHRHANAHLGSREMAEFVTRLILDYRAGRLIDPTTQSEAVASARAEGWQPIETAPTNKAIQVYVPGLDYYGNGGVYAGMLVDMGTGRRWMTFGWAIGRDPGAENTPTHWMPLHAPPTLTPGGRTDG